MYNQEFINRRAILSAQIRQLRAELDEELDNQLGEVLERYSNLYIEGFWNE